MKRLFIFLLGISVLFLPSTLHAQSPSPAAVQYLVTNREKGGTTERIQELMFKIRVPDNHTRALFVPLNSVNFSEYDSFLMFRVMPIQDDPWEALNTKHELDFSPATAGYVQLERQPEIFTQESIPQLQEYLASHNISLDQASSEKLLSWLQTQKQLMVILLPPADNLAGKWTPPIFVYGNMTAPQWLMLPVVRTDTTIATNLPEQPFELAVFDTGGYQAANPQFQQQLYKVPSPPLILGQRHYLVNYVGVVKFSVALGQSEGMQITPSEVDWSKLVDLPGGFQNLPPEQSTVSLWQRVQSWWQQRLSHLRSWWAERRQALSPPPPSPTPTPPLQNWSTDFVEFSFSQLQVRTNNELVFTGPKKLFKPYSQPVYMDSTTLEVQWEEHGQPMRVFVYFQRDDTHWWIYRLDTYDGQGSQADQIGYVTEGERAFATPLGESFTAEDICLYSTDTSTQLCFTNLRLQPFTDDVTTVSGSQSVFLFPSPAAPLHLPLLGEPSVISAVLRQASPSVGETLDITELPGTTVITAQENIEYSWETESDVIELIGKTRAMIDTECCREELTKPFPHISAVVTPKKRGTATVGLIARDTTTGQEIARTSFTIEVE